MPDEPKEPEQAEDDLHRKFREALDRKKQAHHPTADAGDDAGGRNPMATKGSTKRKREFRRKSG